MRVIIIRVITLPIAYLEAEPRDNNPNNLNNPRLSLGRQYHITLITLIALEVTLLEAYLEGGPAGRTVRHRLGR